MKGTIIILDFGGQYKELIAKTVRNQNVFSVIMPGSTSATEIKSLKPIGIILTGGPDSVYAPQARAFDKDILSLNIPILGICYGMQLIVHSLGGQVISGKSGEYGRVVIKPAKDTGLLNGINQPFKALMSHRDVVSTLPKGFTKTASSARYIAAFECAERKIYGVQFHPETTHTQNGIKIIQNFLFNICASSGDYRHDDFIDKQVINIRETVGDKNVLLALSGGVDSAVVAMLLARAIPNQLTCVFVNHGFMRLHEADEIERIFSKQNLRFIRINAEERFLSKIKGVTDPETKRKRIGEEFIRVFEDQAKSLGSMDFLAQGTIYPDIVESGGGQGATIKSHHNVGGLPADLLFKGIIEPLKSLFKDEVRELGHKLGLSDYLATRQPFPGPGLAIRIIGEVTKERLNVLQNSDAIFREEISKLKNKPSQYFAVLTDTMSVGVKGDARTYNPVIAIRAVNTDDFMTCEYTHLSHKTLRTVAQRITSEIPSVTRVVYDITSKPPATIEWE